MIDLNYKVKVFLIEKYNNKSLNLNDKMMIKMEPNKLGELTA